MQKKILLATNNEGKVERFEKLLEHAGVDVAIRLPKDFGLERINPTEDGKTLAENAEIKARAYFGKVGIPILANDTGFWVEGEGLVDAPKRTALGGDDERKLSKKQIADVLLDFWKGVARKHGGKVNAAWEEAFVLLKPDGDMLTSSSRREVILTDKVFGDPHIQMPVRCLYISKTTGKPAIQHTDQEEFFEMKPVTDALCALLM